MTIGAAVARLRLLHLQQRTLPAVDEDRVAGVARIAVRALAVRRLPVHRVGHRVGEEELAGVNDVAAHVHLHVDVHGAAWIPAGVDRLEWATPVEFVFCRPRRNVRFGGARAEAGVDAARVAMPDVHRRSLDRPARRGVDDGQREIEPRAVLALGDVAAKLLAGDVVRAFGHLRGEDALDLSGGHAGGAVFGRLGRAGAERGGDQAAEPEQRAAARQADVVHGRTVAR